MLVPSSNGIHVDTAYSKIFEPALYSNAWLVPSVTCTDKFTVGPAGTIMVHKFASSPLTPGTPGRDFNHATQEDTEIPILLNNNYQTSRKIYQVAINEISAPVAVASLENATQDARMGLEQSALACLYSEAGSTIQGGAVSKDTIKHLILGARASLSKAYASGGVVLASPDAFSALLESAGAEFTPNRNELINTTGRVGTYYGMTVFEVNALATSSASQYYNHAGNLTSVTSTNMNKIQFFMYDADALAIVKSLNAFRMMDGGKDFIGTLAQVEINAGIRLMNTGRAIKVDTTTASNG